MKNDIKLVYVDSYKKCYYLILISFIVDYKKQVIITGIKLNIQYLIFHILPKERKLVI